MEVYALDKDFKLVTIGIPYDNLQWSRKYYEAGSFQMQVSVNIYEPSWQYIGTNGRPELGMIQKVQITGEGDVQVLLSGFFCEKMLDDKAIYPEWKSQDIGNTTPGAAYAYFGIENIARSLFSSRKKDLPIGLGTNHDLKNNDRETVLVAVDDPLGEKLYSFLEAHELSYRVIYDYVSNQLKFEVWQGLDRTQSQNKNPCQVFSSDFGNLTNKTVDIDDSGYKNYAIIPVMDDGETVGADTYYLDWSNGGYRKEIVFDKRSEWPDEYTTDAQFKDVVLQAAAEELAQYAMVEDIDVQVSDNEGYMTDYDLGDRCDVVLSDIGVAMETRIVQVDEVFKADGGHTVTIGLGNKRIDNIRRAVRK